MFCCRKTAPTPESESAVAARSPIRSRLHGSRSLRFGGLALSGHGGRGSTPRFFLDETYEIGRRQMERPTEREKRAKRYAAGAALHFGYILLRQPRGRSQFHPGHAGGATCPA